MKSIIIPAKNEQFRIGKTLEDYCSVFPEDEIIVIANNTTDKTEEVCKYYPVKFFNLPFKMGKGGAIKEGLRRASGNWFGFTDADGATRAENFREMFNYLECYDAAIGVRNSIYKQPLKRVILSQSFRILTSIMLSMNHPDYQTGAKVFNRTARDIIIHEVESNYWTFDVDLIYMLESHRMRISDVKIDWYNKNEDSKVHIIKTPLSMLLDLIRIRLR